jgi:predicted Fe-Mo cluster-binding NifX family protein
MKIAIPLHEGKFCEHFGGAEAFAFYTVDEDSRVIGDRLLGAPPEHGRGVFPVWLRQQGATVVLAGGMGPRAVNIFAHHGVEVVLGVREEDPERIVRSYLDGTLETTGEVCHEHGFHDCGHDHDPLGHNERDDY